MLVVFVTGCVATLPKVLTEGSPAIDPGGVHGVPDELSCLAQRDGH